jgi:geranylgeranyl diphosphate synthase type II
VLVCCAARPSGDALLSHAFEYIGRATPATVPADRTLRVIVDVGKCVGSEGLVGGQVVDIMSEAGTRGLCTGERYPSHSRPSFLEYGDIV